MRASGGCTLFWISLKENWTAASTSIDSNSKVTAAKVCRPSNMWQYSDRLEVFFLVCSGYQH